MESEKKTTTPKKAKTFTESEVQELLKAAVAQALAEQKSTTTIMQVAKEEYVTVLYLGAMADGASVALGKLGNINKAGTTKDIPKKEFIQALGTPVIDDLLSKKQLIVVNGLTEEERNRYGLEYKDNELLTQNAFFKIMDFGAEEICRIFSSLCPEHQQIVSKLYLTAYFERHDNRVNMPTVKKLNKISKKYFKDGLFTPILEDMGAKLAADDEEEI
nr:MAG TPA: hypothetical protein [Caudoviricetes sp.]